MSSFKNTANGFNYAYEKSIAAGDSVILKMPVVSPNKRGINDIGFTAEDGIRLYATISSSPESPDTIWQEINEYDEINKTTGYIKIENTTGEAKRVNIRIIMN